jgi:membrane-associated PAP2 superfamily phosphatase
MVGFGFMQRPASVQPPYASCVRLLGVITLGMVAGVLVFSEVMPLWDTDLAFSHLWWHPPRIWYGDRSAVCWFLNGIGAWPGVLLAVGALGVLVMSLVRKRWRRFTQPALYLVLAFLLGPGLLVNGMLKHGWSRARPKDLVEFGKKEPYEMVLTNVERSIGRSFPSGHASAAFFLCSLGFASALWGTRQGMWAGLALGVVWGTLVAWSRVASGAQFLSDVLWSAALVNAVNFLALVPFLARAGMTSGRGRLLESIAPGAEKPMKAFF